MPHPYLHNDYEAVRIRDLHRIEPGAIEVFNAAEDARIEAFIASHPELVDGDFVAQGIEESWVAHA